MDVPNKGDKFNGPAGIVEVKDATDETVTFQVDGEPAERVLPTDEFCRTYGDDPVRSML